MTLLIGNILFVDVSDSFIIQGILHFDIQSNSLIKEPLKPKSGLGLKLCVGSEGIPCLPFADDCLLFCKADTTNCWRIKHLLDNLCGLSGQLINCHKSTLTLSKRANTAHRHLVAGIFSINHNESLGKYLGCPIFQKRPNRSTFQELLNKAMTKLEGWKANCLSKGG